MPEREAPLRLHHIQHVAHAMEKGALQGATDMLLDTKSSCSPLKREIKPKDFALETDYYLDVVGTLPIIEDHALEHPSTKDEFAYIGRLRSGLQKYISLPDNAKVKLIATGSDWLCEATCFEAHCKVRDAFTQIEEGIAYRLKSFMSQKNISGTVYIKDHHKGREFEAYTSMGVIRSVINSATLDEIIRLMWSMP